MPAKKNDAAALKAAVESVPAAIRDFVAEHFQARFDRLVPASPKLKIFSAHGEFAASGEERSDSAEDDSDSDASDADELSAEN